VLFWEVLKYLIYKQRAEYQDSFFHLEVILQLFPNEGPALIEVVTHRAADKDSQL
jgi:hypothetical protein